MKTLLAIIILLLTFSPLAHADEEASNRPIVRSGQHGAVYAKSVPHDNYGQAGKTSVFAVGQDNDTLLCTYDWYANEMYLGGTGDATLIRFGPWHRGQKPQADHLAIGIYRNGKVIKEYSTLDLQKLGSGLSQSVSHYQVFAQKLGFRWLKGNDFVYEVKGVNNTLFTFDLNTGHIVKQAD